MKKIKYGFFALIALFFCISNVNALEVNKDMVLDKDYDEQFVIDGDVKVEIDLNGHKIVPTNSKVDGIVISVGADVTIKGKGTVQSGHNGITVSYDSKLTLESGDIISSEFGVYTEGNSTFVMNGGTITANDNCGLGGNGSTGKGGYTIDINGGTVVSNIKSNGYVSCGVYHPNEGTININGGIITSTNGPAIVQRAGTLNIKGGVITAQEKTQGIEGKVADGNTPISAAAIVIDQEINYPAVATLKTTITGNPVFTGAAGIVQLFPSNYDFKLTGGVYTQEPAAKLLAEGYVSKKIISGENENKYAVVKEDELKYETSSGMLSSDDLEDDTKTLIENLVKDKYNLASYYDVILLKVTSSDDVIEIVEEIENQVKVTLGVPSDLPKLKEGYIRKYVVVRVHDGEATLIEDVTDNGDGTISYYSDKFSTYAVFYTDIEKDPNPKTGDKVMMYFLILGICSLFLYFVYRRKKETN